MGLDMRISLLTVAIVAPLLALDNSFTVHNWNGTGSGATRKTASTEQANRPFTFFRFFAQGEIANYPRPRIGGIASVTWQSDVKTRWRDATTVVNISSITQDVASGQTLVTTSTAHGFLNLDPVTLQGVTELTSSYRAVVRSTTTFILRGVSYAGPYTLSSPTVTGPTFGSVQQAYISLKSTVGANNAIVIDFVNSTDPCSSGNQAACNTASLDQAGMEAFQETVPGAKDGWGFQISATAAATTYSATARTMLTAGHWRYWLRGPVVTQVIVEDRSASYTYDYGWHLATGVMIVDADPKYKSLHPVFVLTFYPGWPGVKGECIQENVWMFKRQDQIIDVTIKTGGALGTTAYTKAAFRQISSSRWRKIFWDGTAPGDVRLDYNFPYLVYSKALTRYDTTLTQSESSIATWYASYGKSDKGDLGGNAIVTKDMSEGEEEAGLLQGFDVGLLASGDARLYDVMFGTSLYDSAGSPVTGGGGNSAVAGHVNCHRRETATSNNYCQYSCAAGATTAVFGRWASKEYRPTYRLGSEWEIPENAVGDTTTDGWAFDASHAWDTVWAPYLATGDWYFIEELHAWAQGFMLQGNPGTAGYGSHGWWSYVNEHGSQFRGTAWAMRTILYATLATPDSTPEKEYLLNKLQNHIAIREGEQLPSGGLFGPGYPCSTVGYSPSYNAGTGDVTGFTLANNDVCNQWYFARAAVWCRLDTTGSSATTGLNPLNWPFCDATNNPTSYFDSTVAYSGGSAAWWWSFWVTSLSRVADFYDWAEPLFAANAKVLINNAVHPDANPYLLTNYVAAGRCQANTRKAITAATNANPVVFTVVGHGYSTNDVVAICCGTGSWAGVNSPSGWSTYRGATITKVDDDSFSIAVNSTSYGSFAGQTIYANLSADGGQCSDFQEWRNAARYPNQSTLGGYSTDVGSGYPHYTLNVMALLTNYSDLSVVRVGGLRTGARAWDWYRANVPYQDLRVDNLKWSFRPNSITNIRIAGTYLYWSAPSGGGCKVVLQPTPFLASSDTEDDTAACTGRSCSYDVSGKAPGTHYYRISCALGRSQGTITKP